jgi:hypothetical protein
LFQNAAPGTSDGRYRVIRYLDRSDPANTTYDPDTDVLDFEGILVVWKQQVTIPPGSTPIPYRTAVRINAELSWPAQLPYAQRQKSYFTKELFNRQ